MIAALLLLLAAPSDSDVARARLYFESGERAFQAAEYEAAIAAFQQAHEAAPRPALFFSMAQAYRLQYFADGRIKGLENAARLYARYLAEEPKGRRRGDALEHLAAVEAILAKRSAGASDEEESEQKTQLMISANVPAEVEFEAARSKAPLIREVAAGPHTATVSAAGYRPQVVERVAVKNRLVVAHVELVELPARVSLTGADDAELRIDGERIGELPAKELRLASGEHRIQVLDRGKQTYDRVFAFGRDEKVELAIALENTGQRTSAFWMFGTGGGGAVVGGVFLTLALVAQSRATGIQDRLAAGEPLSAADIERFMDRSSDRDDYMLVAAPLLIGSALTLTIGTLLYFLDAPRVEE